MSIQDDDDTVYCDVRMPLAEGLELLSLIGTLRESGSHPALDQVFKDIEDELKASIDCIENPCGWSGPVRLKH